MRFPHPAFCLFFLGLVLASSISFAQRKAKRASSSEQEADSTSNFQYSYNVSAFRLNNYIGQEVRFISPIEGHEFYSEDYVNVQLPHDPFEQSDAYLQFEQYLAKGHMTKAEFEEKRKEYDQSFVIETNIAFPKLLSKETVALSNLSAQHNLLKTDERKITGEAWRIIEVKNLPDLPEENVAPKNWDKSEYSVATTNVAFVLEGLRSGQIINWVVDGNYEVVKPDEYEGVYLVPYLKYHMQKLRRGASYTLLEDMALDRLTGGAVYAKATSKITYGGLKLMPAKMFRRARHGRYMHCFKFGQDSVMAPLHVPVATKVVQGRPGDSKGSGVMRHFQLIPTPLAKKVRLFGGKPLIQGAKDDDRPSRRQEPVEETYDEEPAAPQEDWGEDAEPASAPEEEPVKPAPKKGKKAKVVEDEEPAVVDKTEVAYETDMDAPAKPFAINEDMVNEQKAEENQKAPKRQELMKKYGPVFGSAVVRGKLLNGMSAAMVHDAWGQPTNIENTKKGVTKVTTETFPDFSWVKYYNGKVVAFGGGW